MVKESVTAGAIPSEAVTVTVYGVPKVNADSGIVSVEPEREAPVIVGLVLTRLNARGLLSMSFE